MNKPLMIGGGVALVLWWMSKGDKKEEADTRPTSPDVQIGEIDTEGYTLGGAPLTGPSPLVRVDVDETESEVMIGGAIERRSDGRCKATTGLHCDRDLQRNIDSGFADEVVV